MGEQNTVHVTGFPAGTRATELAPQFERIGRLIRVDIPPLGRFKSIPYAFVEYESLGDAENAIRELNHKPFELDEACVLRVQLARSRPRSGREGYGRERDSRERDPRDFRGPHERPQPRSYREHDDRRGGARGFDERKGPMRPYDAPRGYDERRGAPRGYGAPRRYDERMGAPKPYEQVLVASAAAAIAPAAREKNGSESTAANESDDEHYDPSREHIATHVEASKIDHEIEATAEESSEQPTEPAVEPVQEQQVEHPQEQIGQQPSEQTVEAAAPVAAPAASDASAASDTSASALADAAPPDNSVESEVL